MNRVRIVFVALVTVFIAIAAQSQEPPRGVLAFGPEEYLAANYHRPFDTIPEKGLTIELWFYLDYLLRSDEYAVLLSKPGSYSFEVGNTNGTPRLYVRTWYNAMTRDCSDITIPIDRWIHVCLELAMESPSAILVVKKDDQVSIVGDIFPISSLAQTNVPLFVGGIAWAAQEIMLSTIDPCRRAQQRLVTFESGWIDEIRISRTIRYPEADLDGGKHNPTRPLKNDRDTIALWHFDEGHLALRYRDDSENGYALARNTILAVQPAGKAVVTWAALKHSHGK